MSERLNAALAYDALRMACGRRKPTAASSRIRISACNTRVASIGAWSTKFRMVQSVSRRANCWDNAVLESFFKTLKVERVDQVRYATRAQARLDIVDWIEGFYNQRRLHSSIGYRTPADVERELMAA